LRVNDGIASHYYTSHFISIIISRKAFNYWFDLHGNDEVVSLYAILHYIAIIVSRNPFNFWIDWMRIVFLSLYVLHYISYEQWSKYLQSVTEFTCDSIVVLFKNIEYDIRSICIIPIVCSNVIFTRKSKDIFDWDDLRWDEKPSTLMSSIHLIYSSIVSTTWFVVYLRKYDNWIQLLQYFSVISIVSTNKNRSMWTEKIS
jgi:hypothetical protein